MRSQVPSDFTKFKRKGTLVSNQAAAGKKIQGKPRDKDPQGREILTTARRVDSYKLPASSQGQTVPFFFLNLSAAHKYQ